MTTAARPAPLTRHPAFRWGVAAWFALLLGLGLFVMPEAVHQAIGEKLGLGGVLPGAEAKRVVLSLLAALLGLGIGLVLAMRVTALSDAREPGWDGEIAEDDETDDESSGIWLSDREQPAPAVAPSSAPPIETRARRLFNPREDLAEEGIAPVLDTESIPALEDENTEPALDGTVPMTMSRCRTNPISAMLGMVNSPRRMTGPSRGGIRWRMTRRLPVSTRILRPNVLIRCLFPPKRASKPPALKALKRLRTRHPSTTETMRVLPPRARVTNASRWPICRSTP